MKTSAIVTSLLLTTVLQTLPGQSRANGDYFTASPPNAANMSTITWQFATYANPSAASTVVRSDIPGNVLAIEPIDADNGFVLVLARNNLVVPATSTVYSLLSPFLGGPFVPWFPAFVRYAAPAGINLTDIKVDGFAGGFLTLAIDNLNRISLQRHAGNGPVIATVANLTTAPSAYLGVDSSNGDVYVVDANGQHFRYSSALALISSGRVIPPMPLVTDVIIDNSGGRADRVVISGNLPPFGAGAFRFFTGPVLVIASQILTGAADSLSVDWEGNVTAQLAAGAGVLPMITTAGGISYPFMSTVPQQFTALTWTGQTTFGHYSTSANSQMGLTATPALVGDTTMNYGFNTTAPLTSLAYLISFNYCWPCANLGPFADLLVDLNHPAAQIVREPDDYDDVSESGMQSRIT